MIYQFEHEEVTAEDIREVITVLNAIRYSREEIARKVLPAWAQPYRAIDKAMILSLESLERDLVTILQRETTSCEWCEIASACEYEVTFFKDDDRWATERSLLPKFCPNCGRDLKGE